MPAKKQPGQRRRGRRNNKTLPDGPGKPHIVYNEMQGMYNSDTELVFPMRVIPTLALLRGDEWRQLVERVSAPKAPLAEKLAFVLLMIRLDGCVTCNADSFRAMRGCTMCARQAIRRFRGSDEDLLTQFKTAHEEVADYLDKLDVAM